MAFTHLHLHTEYSLLDGAARISKVVKEAKNLGMDSLAVTDHGVMFGVVDFYKECKREGIRPIIGCEVYTAMRTIYDKEPDKDRRQGHLILLAENQTGYKNLVKIVSAGFTEGFYFKPRIDKNILREHSEGIICMSACLAGNVQRMLLNRDYCGAKTEALELIDIFGKNNFFLEIQNHGLDEDVPVIEGLNKLSKDIGVSLVATNDVHYIRKEDAKAHDVLLAIQTATNIDDEKRMKFANSEFYLKSEAEMRELFPRNLDAVDRTQEIAERCKVDFKFGEYHLPEFIPPKGITNKEYLRQLCYEGLKYRYGEEALDEDNDYRKRLEYELNVIETMGYVEYFLIVWDFIDYAKKNGIMVGPGRGSAAGSIVAYSLRITEIDPIKYNLIFERFLNPERVSMPDIDVDFCIERRQEVIDYVIRKYGKDKVSQIITFGTMKAKAAVRDVGRALNASYAEADSIAKAIPNELNITIKKALEINPELKERYDNEESVKSIIDMSIALEGMPRHASTHAAGIVISKLPLDEYVPLYNSDKGISTQFNMTTIEELGLLKMDFLGLRNLTVIRDALLLIKNNHGVDVDFTKMEYNDPGVFEMISEGNTQGVFQLESGGMTDFMKNLKPTSFEDIVAGISLYRPGPMDSIPKYIENKKHPEKIRYADKQLKPILDVTYGCLVYQEQVMQIVRDLGGYSYGRSDLVRRAMSKKKMKVMLEEKEYFINGKKDENGNIEIKGCVANGIPAKAAREIFDDMVGFAQYAFNKSHAAAYAVIAYETGYLKYHYPVEFMAALMTSVTGEANHIAKYIQNCKKMRIEILPPSVMKSEKKFSVENGKIRFGMLGIKHVGGGAIDAVIKARETNSTPADIYQFIAGIDPKELNKKAIESLIKAGALDCINTNRAAHLAVFAKAVEAAQHKSKKVIEGQISLFQTNTTIMESADVSMDLPDVANFNKETLLNFEKEMLGVYLSGHPLDDYEEFINNHTTVTTDDLENAGEVDSKLKDGNYVVMAGMITNVKKMITKKSQEMAFVQMEDYYGSVEMIVFPYIYEKCKSKIIEDNIVGIKGKLNFKEDETPKVIVDTVESVYNLKDINKNARAVQTISSYSAVSKKPSPPAEPLKLKISDDIFKTFESEGHAVRVLSDILWRFPGNKDVLIYLPGGKALKVDNEHKVLDCGILRWQLEKLLGKENIKGWEVSQ